MKEVEGIFSVAVECVDIKKNTESESTLLVHYWHWEAKAKGAKRIRYPCSFSCKWWKLGGGFLWLIAVANALSFPPGKYARKGETQRDWRGPAQVEEYAV